MEWFYICFAVFNRNSVTEADTFYLMVAEPPSRLCIDKQSLILRAVGCRGKGREFPVAVQNDNIAFLNAIAAGTIQISSADVSVGFQEINIYINGTAMKVVRGRSPTDFPSSK